MKRTKLSIMMQLIVLIKPMLLIMTLAIVLGVLGFICANFIPILGSILIGDLLQGNNTIQPILILLAIISIARGILRYGEQTCNHYIAFKLLAMIRDKVFTVLRKLAPAKLEGKEKGQLITIITNDIELLEVFYAHTISPICIAIIMSIIMTIFIGGYSVELGIIALIGYISVGVIIPLIVSSKVGKDASEIRQEVGNISSFFLDNIRGVQENIQYKQGYVKLDEIDRMTDEMSLKEKQLKRMSGKTTMWINNTIFGFGFVMFIVSSMMYLKGAVPFEVILVSTVSMISSFGPVVALGNLGHGLSQTLAAGDRVLNLLDEKPVVNDVENEKNIAFANISVNSVSFGYQETPILENINLPIENNKILGIVGKSGSGKSTLLKLLMRFWDVQQGNIEIANEDIRNINTKDLRNHQSYVTQETILFKDTIENNIKVAKLDATNEEVVDACKKAAIHDMIMSLPQGYKTQVGELGDTLSGGEKQRIGVARSFLHDAPFMFLDEPTSNLDSLNEAVLLKSIYEQRENKTIVLVSHRESTMKIVDQLITLDSGRVS
ncbi:amino acid ABC transporter ATP-binding/permease protein [Anaerorhabdus furcosa]|uniref:ATP-binding cassette, subfamily C n=1 Tax=Anaerorhabdus furcosa TaxID=118967 RepID=A0A1T4K3I6_9FIRM|nr:ABC transporter ATP-binding protein [Anaerorhabdus furcosa]SJZ36913.1 ATP-binding cassette, subfamily C [Anaerorhabdus furcosa]